MKILYHIKYKELKNTNGKTIKFIRPGEAWPPHHPSSFLPWNSAFDIDIELWLFKDCNLDDIRKKIQKEI